MSTTAFASIRGQAVVLYLQNPKEKIWGVLIEAAAAGVLLRGLDLAIFEDWMRQEARGAESALGPSTLFYPLWRLERMELDVRVGAVASCTDRFEATVSRPIEEALGLSTKRVNARRRKIR